MSVAAIGPEYSDLIILVLSARNVDDYRRPLAIPFPLLA